MIRLLIIVFITFGGSTLYAQDAPPETQPAESQPVEQPAETQPTEVVPETQPTKKVDKKADEKKTDGEAPPDAVDEPDPYQLAIDYTLLPEQSRAPTGNAISEKREADQIGHPRRLTLIEGLAWIPRVVFFPVYLVTEYLIRWPLGKATVWVEKNHVIDRFIEVTSFDEGKGRIAPRLNIYSGFAPSFGLTLLWRDAFLEGNDYVIGADAGFNRNLTVDVATRYRFWDDLAAVSLRYAHERRNDYVFYGIGSETFEEDESRFFRVKNTGVLQLRIKRTAPGFGVKTSVEISDYAFGCSEGDDDLCGVDGIANTPDDRLPIDSDTSANFFTSGYQILRYKGLVSWDSREERPANGTGLRLEAIGRVGQSLKDDNIQFVRYGGEAAGFWDIYNQRVIGLRFYGEIADPIGDGEIPFGELVVMGGVESMRGFRTARFHGRSAFVGTLDYRFPVWSFFDGNIFFEAGNTFGERFEDFSPEKLRPSIGLSLKTINSRYNAIDFTVAFGGTQFDAQPIAIDSFNIGVGTNFGF